ncbi:MAG: adenylyl-sulfate kinase [Saprospiraceae bacterium]
MNKTPEHIYPIFDKILQTSAKEKLLNQKGKVFWVTGLSGSGKSTIAQHTEALLHSKGILTQILDGDNIRAGLNNNLSFSAEDRKENIRRIAEVAKLFANCGIVTIASFISPTIEIRQMAKSIIGADKFYEIFINTPLAVCEERDVKGLYKKARAGVIKNFTGIDAPFEAPLKADLEIKTDNINISESANQLFNFINNEL